MSTVNACYSGFHVQHHHSMLVRQGVPHVDVIAHGSLAPRVHSRSNVKGDMGHNAVLITGAHRGSLPGGQQMGHTVGLSSSAAGRRSVVKPPALSSAVKRAMSV